MRRRVALLTGDLLIATVVTAATLSAWGVSLLVESHAGQHVDLVVMTVALSVTLARNQLERPARPPWLLLAVPPAAALASFVGSQMARDHRLGDVLFVVVLSVAVWVRRFGPGCTTLGTLTTLPLVAALITPYVPEGEIERASWSAVLGATSALITLLCLTAARRLAPAHFPGTTAPRPSDRPAASRNLSPSTRMAIQLAGALVLGFAIGRHVNSDHWQWPVLTAYIVSSANQGRGDVLYKGIQRGLGAGLGTVVAALLTGIFGIGDHRAVACIFVVLWFALAVRRASYAYWAGSVTAALALVYGFFGDGGTAVLGQRLEGIGLGAVAGIAVTWLVLPIRTEDVLRRRMGALLEALQNLLVALGENPSSVGADQVRPVVVASVAITRVMQPLTARGRWLRRLRLRDHWEPVIPAADLCAEKSRTLVRFVRTTREPLDHERISVAQAQTVQNLTGLRQSLRSRERADVRPVLSGVPDEGATGQVLTLLHVIDEAAVRMTATVSQPVAAKRSQSGSPG
ncbi:FUSC family protein [Kineosporia mesophila]|uniref:FUSC family protein n=1 Tax=Kineosporia mesophila TaxID=566012 RepID=UPI001E414717|nr:FUSC family protein [Kineosporia mesophila]MCD5354541.1 FUSC family protein [Kineosporia mesophila]